MVARRQNGFTLIEMLVVLAIISVMSGALSVFLQNSRDDVARVERVDRWQDQARSTFSRLAADIRGSGFVIWEEDALTVHPNGGAVVYRVDQVGDDSVLTREENGQATVMATDVAHLEVETSPTIVRVRLEFYTWVGDYRARASHAVAVAISPRPGQGETP